MNLFWYIRTITQYVLVCTGLYYYTFPVLVCTRYVLVCTASEPVHTEYPVPVMHFTIPDEKAHARAGALFLFPACPFKLPLALAGFVPFAAAGWAAASS